MDVAVDLYLAVPLLFTVLALVLASVFVRLRGSEGERAAERPREPAAAAAEPAREGGPGSGGEAAAAAPEGAGPAPAAAEGPEDEGGRVPVEEVGAGEEGKEAAGEQREAAAEPVPVAELSPAAAESIPRQPPAEPREPGNREDAESKVRPDPLPVPRDRVVCTPSPPRCPFPAASVPVGGWQGGSAAPGFSSKTREFPAKAGGCPRVGTSLLSPRATTVMGGLGLLSTTTTTPPTTTPKVYS